MAYILSGLHMDPLGLGTGIQRSVSAHAQHIFPLRNEEFGFLICVHKLRVRKLSTYAAAHRDRKRLRSFFRCDNLDGDS